MSHPRSPHPLRRPSLDSWAVAVLLAASSLACGDDDPTPSTIVKISGDEQVGRVSGMVPNPLVVRLLDDSGVPVSGVVVVWTAQGGGSVDPESVMTDADGLAATNRVLGPTAGNQTTTAAVSELPGIPPATFTAIALVEE
jgi:hypothetical protein